MIENTKEIYTSHKILTEIEISGSNISEGDIKKFLSNKNVYSAFIVDETGFKLKPYDLPKSGKLILKIVKSATFQRRTNGFTYHHIENPELGFI